MQDVDLTPDGMIHDRGRGPEIKGTRITVYSIMDHYGKADWPRVESGGLTEPAARRRAAFCATSRASAAR